MRSIKFGNFDARLWTDVRDNIKESNQFDVIFLEAFSLFALLASGLILANSVGGQVLSQVRDIGILKAIGFTPRQVTLTLLGQNLGLGLLAGVVGIACGLLVAPFFLERSADILAVPASPALNPTILGITLIAVLAIVGLFTLFPAWRAGRVGAIAALTAGTEAGGTHPSRAARLAAHLGLPRVAVIGLKDLTRHPARTAMTIVALVLAVVTATFSLGIESTFKATMSDASVIGGPPFQIASDRDLEPDAAARQIFASHPEISGYLVQYRTGGRIGNRGFDVRGYEGDLNDPRWAVREGRMPARAGEAAISNKLATDFGLKVGDQVSAVIFGPPPGPGAPTSLTIVGRYVDIDGNVMTVTRETLPPDVDITDYLIRTKPGTDDKALADALVKESGGNLDPEVISKTVAGIRNQWRPVIFGLNGVLFAIAGLNLLSSLLLTIRERRRDFAVLKTIGFTPAQITQSVFAGSAFLASIAVVIGLPLGLAATRVMFEVLSNAADIGGGVGELPGPLWLLPLVPGAIAVAALGTVLPARRAASVHIADALRYE
jgi:putative ABC transport system permease protein